MTLATVLAYALALYVTINGGMKLAHTNRSHKWKKKCGVLIQTTPSVKFLGTSLLYSVDVTTVGFAESACVSSVQNS